MAILKSDNSSEWNVFKLKGKTGATGRGYRAGVVEVELKRL